MVKVKGKYIWELRNSQDVVEERGEQTNLITDVLLTLIPSATGFNLGDATYRIVLSEESTPLPVAEYREDGIASANISRDEVSGYLSDTFDAPTRSFILQNSFSPPVGLRTITVLGLDIRYLGATTITKEFMSFVVLTTPITQNTDQYLFVQYTITLEYTGGLYNYSANPMVTNYFNSDVTRLVSLCTQRNTTQKYFKYTGFLPASNKDHIARSVSVRLDYDTPSIVPNNGCRYAQDFTTSLGVTEKPGLIGAPVWQYEDANPNPDQFLAYGQYAANLAPTISRVFGHPDKEVTTPYSDPSNPPLSRGTVTPSGTPTNTFPVIVRVRITKSGDASDITDETFTTDYILDELTVSQDEWAVDDIVQVSSTVTLPDPLVVSTDYYVVSKTGTSPSVKLKLSLTEGGSVITLTDNGSGVHTVVRQNTGEYKLELEPHFTSTFEYQEALQATPAEDTDGELYPAKLPPSPYLDDLDDLYFIAQDSNYHYFVYPDTTGNYLEISRWEIFTLATSQPLYRFGTSGLTFNGSIRGQGTYSDYVYLATSVGVYRFNQSTPAIPTLMTITNLVSSEIKDVAFDSATEYLWLGHGTGLTRVDLATNIGVKYENGSGDLLDGAHNDAVNCFPGSIRAYNGKVLVNRAAITDRILYIVDGTGFYTSQTLGKVWGHLIDPDDEYIIVRRITGHYWAVYSITGVTGKDTGTINLITQQASTEPAAESSFKRGPNMYQVGYRRYMAFPLNGTSYLRQEYWDRDLSEILFIRSDQGGGQKGAYQNENLHISESNNLVDFSPEFGGVFGYFNGQIYVGGPYPRSTLYGYNAAWVKDYASSRRITETGTQSLGAGISVAFANDLAAEWDKNFIEDERFTFVISPTLVKDNLQELSIKSRFYYCKYKRVVEYASTVPISPYVLTVPEAPTGSAPDTDFRDLETIDFTNVVEDVTSATILTKASSSPPGDGEYWPEEDGTIEFHANQTGDSVKLTYNYTQYV